MTKFLVAEIYTLTCILECLLSKLYWTDQGTESGIPAKVASADMDGLNPVILFTNNLDHIEFLTVDIRENKLYWAVTSTGMVGLGCLSCCPSFFLYYKAVILVLKKRTHHA